MIVGDTNNRTKSINIDNVTGGGFIIFRERDGKYMVLIKTDANGVTAIDEMNQEKPKGELLKIVDVLAKETKAKSNMPLFYIYSDGTVEKKIIIN